MNRFRTKKKAKEAPEGIARASNDSEGPSFAALKKTRTFGRKKNVPEPQPQIDLVNALPSSADLRTSLLMSGLSARFSMLREQDDPNSKLGKASDDSVLFPKRQSRLNDFGFQSHGLSDIAEVSSIHGSIRPPFATERKGSYTTESNATDDDSMYSGSIMNRAKPGEGNNLFGGRQKIYKIPVSGAGSTKSLTDGGGGMGGRALYENDVSQSAFQKLKEREREQERQAQEEKEEREAQSSRPPSAISGYNRKRETSSTTSSGPSFNARTSTAATSVTSQRTPSLNGSHTPITPWTPASNNGALDRSVTKTRRLYETGLDQHLHEQQYSAMNRMDTLSRQRVVGTRSPPLNSPASPYASTERWDRHPLVTKASMPNIRSASPTVNSALNGFDFSDHSSDGPDSKAYGMSSPPLSPPMTDNDDAIAMSVRPNDRGKATALGAFNKPAQAYDENKYMQLQLQMHQGRETPPPRKQSPSQPFVPRQQPMGRIRAESNATFTSNSTNRSRSNSAARQHFPPPDRISDSGSKTTPITVPEEREISSGTFLNSPDDSTMSSPVDQAGKPESNSTPLDLSKMQFHDQNVNLQQPPPEAQHPANRVQPTDDNTRPIVNTSNTTPPRIQPSAPRESDRPLSHTPADSPTLGPTVSIAGLSGMVRQHLRADSNVSSVYEGTSDTLTSRFPDGPQTSTSQEEHNGTSNGQWDNHSWDKGDYASSQFTFNSADQAKDPDAVPPPLSVRSPTTEGRGEARKTPWQKDLESRHSRDGSTETQKERQDFHNDLAERRRRVQENLKSFVETESRSASPLPQSDPSSTKNNPLGLLKSKSSRGSLIVKSKDQAPSKAMKMLGIANTTISSSTSPNSQNFDDALQMREGDAHGRPVGGPVQGGAMIPSQMKAFRQARREAQRDRERQTNTRHPQKMGPEGNFSEESSSTSDNHPLPRGQNGGRIPPNIRTRQRSPSREKRPPPVTYSHRNRTQESLGSISSSRSGSSPPRPSRDRSTSDDSGRSKIPVGRYRDDRIRGMSDGPGPQSPAQGLHTELEIPSGHIGHKSPGTPALQFQPSPIPSPMMAPANRSRSNSRAGPPSAHFESQNLQPVRMGDALPSPRPSPTAPFSINPTPSQPSPAGSGRNTPTSQAFQPQNRAASAARKRSINKQDISEPKFVSSTSRITTVMLPPEASLQNGMESPAPPIPPVNPMRRQTRGMFGLRKKDELNSIQSLPAATQSTEEMSTFSADEGDHKPKYRQKLRKSSSEGGNLNAKARAAAFAQPSPALPTFPPRDGSPPHPVEGGMF